MMEQYFTSGVLSSKDRQSAWLGGISPLNVTSFTQVCWKKAASKTLAYGGDVECKNIWWQRTTFQMNGLEVWIVEIISATVFRVIG